MSYPDFWRRPLKFSLLSIFLACAGEAADNIDAKLSCSRYFLNQQYSAALEYCREVVRASPTYTAHLNLGIMALQGWGAPRDIPRALDHFRAAIQLEGSDGTAEHNLGVAYSSGIGGPTDRQEGLRHYRKAAQAGHEQSQFNLSVAYFYGDGVVADAPKAYAWMLVAERYGSMDARRTLPEMRRNLSASEIQRGEALAGEIQRTLARPRLERLEEARREFLEMPATP
jgi:TPR repeat protein